MLNTTSEWLYLIMSLKEYLFPIFCVGCNQEGIIVCENCFQNIPINGVFCCPVCHVDSLGGQVCASCASVSSLGSQIALSEYSEEALIGKIVRALKYDFIEEALEPISRLWQSFLPIYLDLFTTVDAIVAVPLHPRRLAERGYNQAELIARIVGEILEKPLIKPAKRTRYTQKQAKLDKAERAHNSEGIFAVGDHRIVAGQTILIVDDVFTTGATTQSLATTLLAAGASRVSGLSLARPAQRG